MISRLFLTNGLIACLTFLLFSSNAAYALSSDPEQPMEIEADEAEVDEERGLTEYRGAVVVNQGSIRIQADTVTVHDGKNGFEKVVLTGKPARFRQRPDNSNEYIKASARRIEYITPKNLLLLIDQASVKQGNDLFSGNRISYDTKRNKVKARKAKSGKERVKITIGGKK